MNRVDFVAVVCACILLASVGWMGVHAARDPMAGRLARLETELVSGANEAKDYAPSLGTDYGDDLRAIGEHLELWKELVPPPRAKPKAAPAPNLKKMLQGVSISLRDEIGAGEEVKVLVKISDDNRGQWLGVGAKLRNLTIVKIDSDSVVFELKRGKKEFHYSLERK